jgi:hypothetical protein
MADCPLHWLNAWKAHCVGVASSFIFLVVKISLRQHHIIQPRSHYMAMYHEFDVSSMYCHSLLQTFAKK